ncbi:hypothetical protein HMI54_009334 [Coelomomyces lativittatus]|nr:hypothetical protein HMI56_004144 [Coelomomyces lativittatus]KAJ1501076.1 hypothetical protein HMI55_003594 [Coelomomyces lativittatus]KAJ1502112.1 hypothetical protein HMI54_009334 [Coelomomyces lativittatus]
MLGLSKLFPNLRKNIILFRVIYIGIIVLIWLSVILPTYILYKKEIRDRNFLEPTKLPEARHFINVSARLGFIDPLAGQFRLSLDFQPINYQQIGMGPELFRDFAGEKQLLLDIVLYIAQLKVVFKKYDRLAPVDVSIFFVNGTSRDYPFDIYATSFSISAYDLNNETNVIPLQIYMNAAVPGYSLSQYEMNASNALGGSVSFFFYIRRSGTTIGFSIFIMVLSWGLSLIMSFLTLQIVLKNRLVEPAMLGPPCTLLFALPTLRNAQPGIPEIGTTFDVVSYFWNIALVAMSSVFIILTFILRWQALPPPPPTPPETLLTSTPPSPTSSFSSTLPTTPTLPITSFPVASSPNLNLRSSSEEESSPSESTRSQLFKSTLSFKNRIKLSGK